MSKTTMAMSAVRRLPGTRVPTIPLPGLGRPRTSPEVTLASRPGSAPPPPIALCWICLLSLSLQAAEEGLQPLPMPATSLLLRQPDLVGNDMGPGNHLFGVTVRLAMNLTYRASEGGPQCTGVSSQFPTLGTSVCSPYQGLAWRESAE